jgi:hypothetical protein
LQQIKKKKEQLSHQTKKHHPPPLFFFLIKKRLRLQNLIMGVEYYNPGNFFFAWNPRPDGSIQVVHPWFAPGIVYSMEEIIAILGSRGEILSDRCKTAAHEGWKWLNTMFTIQGLWDCRLTEGYHDCGDAEKIYNIKEAAKIAFETIYQRAQASAERKIRILDTAREKAEQEAKEKKERQIQKNKSNKQRQKASKKKAREAQSSLAAEEDQSVESQQQIETNLDETDTDQQDEPTSEPTTPNGKRKISPTSKPPKHTSPAKKHKATADKAGPSDDSKEEVMPVVSTGISLSMVEMKLSDGSPRRTSPRLAAKHSQLVTEDGGSTTATILPITASGGAVQSASEPVVFDPSIKPIEEDYDDGDGGVVGDPSSSDYEQPTPNPISTSPQIYPGLQTEMVKCFRNDMKIANTHPAQQEILILQADTTPPYILGNWAEKRQVHRNAFMPGDVIRAVASAAQTDLNQKFPSEQVRIFGHGPVMSKLRPMIILYQTIDDIVCLPLMSATWTQRWDLSQPPRRSRLDEYIDIMTDDSNKGPNWQGVTRQNGLPLVMKVFPGVYMKPESFVNVCRPITIGKHEPMRYKQAALTRASFSRLMDIVRYREAECRAESLEMLGLKYQHVFPPEPQSASWSISKAMQEVIKSRLVKTGLNDREIVETFPKVQY